MADFNPPTAPPEGVRKIPISLGDIIDLQHRKSGAHGFATVYRVWYVAGGDFHREIHAPTLGTNPIGHSITSAGNERATSPLVSGSNVYIKTTAPRQNNNDVWPYLGAWLNKEPGEDNVASYFDNRDGERWLHKAQWQVVKLQADGNEAPAGTQIDSGDGVRIKNLKRLREDGGGYRVLLGRGRAAIDPQAHGDDLLVMHDNTAPATAVDWVIWKH